MSLLKELKRRNVFRAGTAYLVAAWLIVQVAETILPSFGFGEGAIRTIVTVLAIGLIPVLITAWIFELTPEGIKREREVDYASPAFQRFGKKLDRLIMMLLALGLAAFAFDKFVLLPHREAEKSLQQQAEIEKARGEGHEEALVDSYGDKSIAVLPFANLSNDADNEYFSDGISEEILNLLARIPELRVISRSSAFAYKGKEIHIPDVAQKLNVTHVLEGSVRKSGFRVRITAQLIEGGTDTHIWSQTWDRTLDDIFAIQDEIAADVVSKLQVSLVGALPTAWPTDPEVYALTLQARHRIEGIQRSSELTGIEDLLTRALSIDPKYVPALEAKDRVARLMMIAGMISGEELDQRWRITRSQILGADPNNVVVANFDAWNLYESQRDIEAAAASYESLLLKHPNDAEVLRVVGRFLRHIGFFEQSVAVLERCVLVDPLKHPCVWELKEAFLWSGQLEQSRTFADRINAIFGRTAGSNDIYRLLLEGRPAEAWDQALSLHHTSADPVIPNALLALAAHDLGKQEAFKQYLDQTITVDSEDYPEYRRLLYVTGIYAYIGDLDRAFASLEDATTINEPYCYLQLMNPWHKPLHQDLRWTKHRQRLGLSESRLAAIEFSVPAFFLHAP